MVNDFTVPSAATSAPSTPATSNTATAELAEADAGNDFVSVLADALTAEASAAAATAPVTTVAVKQDEIDASEDLLDVQAMFIDPQALMLSLGQGARKEVPVATESPGTRGIDSQAERVVLTALSATAASVPASEQSTVESTALFDAAAKSARNARDVLVDSKPERPIEDSSANILAANVTHERVAELREQPVIRSHVGTATWTEELAGKLTVMVGRGLQSASLRLTPEHLGPMEIRISVQNEQASVWFGAAHADTRTALEQALPRLRELLAGQGLNLSDAGVFRETPRQPNKQYSTGTAVSGEGEREFSISAVRARGMVDAYA